MVKQKRQHPLLMALIFTVALFTTSTQAGGLPGYYPETFQWLGTINEIDAGRRAIVIRDAFFPLAKEVKVYTPRSQYATLRSLRPGMRVGCRLEIDERGVKVVSAIWVLPSSKRGLMLPPPSHH